MKRLLRKMCKTRDSIFKDTRELNFHQRSSYERVEMKSLMPVGPMAQVSSTGGMSHPWEPAVNETARTKDSDLLEFLKCKSL